MAPDGHAAIRLAGLFANSLESSGHTDITRPPRLLCRIDGARRESAALLGRSGLGRLVGCAFVPQQSMRTSSRRCGDDGPSPNCRYRERIGGLGTRGRAFLASGRPADRRARGSASTRRSSHSDDGQRRREPTDARSHSAPHQRSATPKRCCSSLRFPLTPPRSRSGEPS